MRKFITAVIVVLVAAAAWYLLSPIWRVEELNEPSPLTNDSIPQSAAFSSPVMEAKDSAAFSSAMMEMKDKVMEMSESMPAEASILSESAFVADAHEVKGTAMLIEKDGSKVIRFEDFETINGPNLHIYLSADLAGNDYIDLGPIRATKGSANYTLDPSIDTAKYRHVLVWCVPFGVLFSHASL